MAGTSQLLDIKCLPRWFTRRRYTIHRIHRIRRSVRHLAGPLRLSANLRETLFLHPIIQAYGVGRTIRGFAVKS